MPTDEHKPNMWVANNHANGKTLLVAASTIEVRPLITASTKNEINDLQLHNLDEHNAHLLITGVGQYNALTALSHYLNTFPAPLQIINIGIAGSFGSKFKILDLCKVKRDYAADQIVEQECKWTSHSKAGIPNTTHHLPEVKTPEFYQKIDLPEATAITTDFLTDNQQLINKRQEFFKADIESMEGAAVFHMANYFNIQAMQIKSISNFVGERDKTKWRIDDAIVLLCNFVRQNIFPIIK